GSVRQEIAGLLTAGTGTTNAVVGSGSNIGQLTVNIAGTPAPYTGNLGGTGGNQNAFGLRKIGAGVFEPAGTNTYFGGTIIEAGTLKISSDAKLGGVGSVAGGTPASPMSPFPNNVIINGGTLQTTATTTIQTNRGIALGPVDGAVGGTGTISTDASTILTYG